MAARATTVTRPFDGVPIWQSLSNLITLAHSKIAIAGGVADEAVVIETGMRRTMSTRPPGERRHTRDPLVSSRSPLYQRCSPYKLSFASIYSSWECTFSTATLFEPSAAMRQT